jgi:hypothetical protein
MVAACIFPALEGITAVPPPPDAAADAADSDGAVVDAGAGDADAGGPIQTVECGPASCRVDRGEVCCTNSATRQIYGCALRGTCASITDAAAAVEARCDDVTDCADQPGTVCCATCRQCSVAGPTLCARSCAELYDRTLCDPAARDACPDAAPCRAEQSGTTEGICF